MSKYLAYCTNLIVAVEYNSLHLTVHIDALRNLNQIDAMKMIRIKKTWKFESYKKESKQSEYYNVSLKCLDILKPTKAFKF